MDPGTLNRLTAQAYAIVFLTGAGVSAPSGLPTYTDADGKRVDEGIVVVNKGDCSLMTSKWRRWIIAHHKGDCSQLFDSAMSVGAKYSALSS